MFTRGTLWTGILSGGLSQIQHTLAYRKGALQKNEYTVQTAANITGALGVMSGVEYGAVLGSLLLPGIGTIAGSLIGGIIGNQLGRFAGARTVSIFFKANRAD